jgi:putative salt-induced outer membrane protein YdiY
VLAQSNEAALREREEQLALTLRTKSRDEMERLLAAQFVLRGTPDVDRETWMKEALSRCWGDRFDIDDFSARVEGTTAITSFALTFYVNPDTCQPATLRSLITDIWIREEDQWRLAVRHSSAATAGVAAQFAVIPDAPPRWALSSELSFVSTAGNTSTATLGVAADLTHETPASSSRVRFGYVSSETDDVTQAQATTVEARHGFKVRPNLEIFGRSSYARDRFAGIDNRGTLDGGVAYSTGRRPRHQLTFEAAIGFTVEDRIASDTLRFATGTGTTRYVWQVASGTELREEAAFTADLGEARNWRATNDLALSVALTRLLSLKIANDFEYRNLPVTGFRRADSRTAAAIVLTFRAQ